MFNHWNMLIRRGVIDCIDLKRPQRGQYAFFSADGAKYRDNFDLGAKFGLQFSFNGVKGKFRIVEQDKTGRVVFSYLPAQLRTNGSSCACYHHVFSCNGRMNKFHSRRNRVSSQEVFNSDLLDIGYVNVVGNELFKRRKGFHFHGKRFKKVQDLFFSLLGD